MVMTAAAPPTGASTGLGEDGYADGDGVRLHYVARGDGPVVLLLHGFPDFWYGWRHQLAALAGAGLRAVALDLRGYNLSDKPRRVRDYASWRPTSWACLTRPARRRPPSWATTGAPPSPGTWPATTPTASAAP